jgi:hypothetical protein
MITLSFDDVSLTMSPYDWDRLRKFLTWAIETVPVECVREYEVLLEQIGMGFATHTRLYKEKNVVSSE